MSGIPKHDVLMIEKLTVFSRAGCSGILTDFAADAAGLLHG
jgi:porphobilinogen synthase